MSDEIPKHPDDWKIEHLDRIEKYVIELRKVYGNKIAELEQKFKHQCENCQILMQDRVNEIEELKEQFEKREEHQFQDYFKLQRFEEVLRDILFPLVQKKIIPKEVYDKLSKKLEGEQSVSAPSLSEAMNRFYELEYLFRLDLCFYCKYLCDTLEKIEKNNGSKCKLGPKTTKKVTKCEKFET